MKQSELFIKSSKTFPNDEEALSAKFLARGGFVNKEAAGVYSFLPLGLRVIRKIEGIIREGMKVLGAQEILMPVLHPKENWKVTGRWNSFDALYKIKSREGKEMALGPTHEEIIFPIAKKVISSYRDLPVYLYQIQDKMRDESRAKSGILRGREFLMKDLYSFHGSEGDLGKFYEKMKSVYIKIFKSLGLEVRLTEASGGTFSKYSHEFQVLLELGEDLIFYCERCDFSQNKEIFQQKDESNCPNCGGMVKSGKAIEVGNIFKLNTRFSEPFKVTYKTKDGKEELVWAGCYGIGISRLAGTIAEVFHDENGIIWPEAVAPFSAHLIELLGGKAIKVYKDLQAKGVEVLYDDREISAGEKFAEADLLGIPWRLVVSAKTEGKVEVKRRDGKSSKLVAAGQLAKLLQGKK